MSTVWHWLKSFGFKYHKTQRSYYTGGHERADVVHDRDNQFLKEYFFHGLKTYRWLQVESSVATDLENQHIDFPRNCSYIYTKNGKEFREYHIDMHYSLENYVSVKNQKYGGNLSVRFPTGARPLLLIGQDESTYHQYIFSK